MYGLTRDVATYELVLVPIWPSRNVMCCIIKQGTIQVHDLYRGALLTLFTVTKTLAYNHNFPEFLWKFTSSISYGIHQ